MGIIYKERYDHVMKRNATLEHLRENVTKEFADKVSEDMEYIRQHGYTDPSYFYDFAKRNSISGLIKVNRVRMGLSQKSISKMLNVCLSSYNMFETLNTMAGSEVIEFYLEALSLIFGKSPMHFFETLPDDVNIHPEDKYDDVISKVNKFVDMMAEKTHDDGDSDKYASIKKLIKEMIDETLAEVSSETLRGMPRLDVLPKYAFKTNRSRSVKDQKHERILDNLRANTGVFKAQSIESTMRYMRDIGVFTDDWMHSNLEIAELFGVRARAAREYANKSIKEVSELLQVSGSMITKIENRSFYPSTGAKLKLYVELFAFVYGVSPLYFIDESARKSTWCMETNPGEFSTVVIDYDLYPYLG